MPLVVAHRGASAAHPPGNTLAAFAASRPSGADGVELDTHLTADGVAVVHHDPVFADGRAIGALRVSELPSEVPSLVEAIDACDELHVNVEIKPDGPDALRPRLISTVVSLLGTFGDVERFLVTSFSDEIVDEVRGLDATIPTGQLTMADLRAPSSTELLAEVARRGHRSVNPWHTMIDDEAVARAHDLGLHVNVWTVDAVDRMRALSLMGVDAIITNVPDVCREVVDTMEFDD